MFSYSYLCLEIGELVALTLIVHLKGTMDMNITSIAVIKSELIIREFSPKKGSKYGDYLA